MNKKQSAWRSPWVVAWVAILAAFVVIVAGMKAAAPLLVPFLGRKG